MSDTSSEKAQEVEECSPREALIRSLNKDFSSYTHDANFCVYLKFVRNREEAEDDIKEGAFFPDFVHQFFVDQERIFGYKKPILRIFYTASRLKRYINFDYEDKLTKEKDGINADDVMSHLNPITEDQDYTKDLNQFIVEASCKEEREFRPIGDLLYEFECEYKKHRHFSRAQRELLEDAGELGLLSPTDNGNASSLKSVIGDFRTPDDASASERKKFQIFHATHDSKGFNHFQMRMQTLVMWFIESANMIDFEDPRWDCFLIFEKYNPSEVSTVSTEDRYFFAGYATVYRYYAYPDRTRPRVSQMILLPHYRRNGLGTTLLQCIYDYFKKQPATLDITAEDPDEEFISMRDLLDCKNCLSLPSFSPEKVKQGWSEIMAEEAQDKLKLCHRQARKIYEILKLKLINKSDETEYRDYRLEIKNRLNTNNQKQRMSVERATKKYPNLSIPDDLKFQDKVTSAKLEDNFRLLEKQYQHVIEKLNRSTVHVLN